MAKPHFAENPTGVLKLTEDILHILPSFTDVFIPCIK